MHCQTFPYMAGMHGKHQLSQNVSCKKVTFDHNQLMCALVDWLWVPTPIRENCVRAWVEVVVLLWWNFSLQRSMKYHPAVRWWKVAGPAVYKNIAEFNEIRTSHSEGSCTRGRLTMKLCIWAPRGVGREGLTGPHRLRDLKHSTYWQVPSVGPERGKLREETRWVP